MSETYQSAPVLKWMGQPFNGKGTYSETNTEGYYFFRINGLQRLANKLPGLA